MGENAESNGVVDTTEKSSEEAPPKLEFENQDLSTEAADTENVLGWRFWIIFLSLAITSLLTAIEATVTSTALPTIARDLNSGKLYVWFVNAFFLTSTAVQPLYGQFANVFGRRWPTMVAIALFALGSGISGGSTSAPMLIGGRAIQGMGLGGVNVMIDMIVCDLVPLRKRGNYIGMIYVVFAVGSSIGPFVGGVFTDRVTWRWVFYICLPICGVSLALMLVFLQVKYQKETTFKQKMARVDWLGNALLIASVVAVLIALTYGGTSHPWSSWRVVLPLVLGFLGIIAFHIYEASGYCVEPTMPPRLFGNRTSLFAFVIIFLHGALTYWIVYFLPVYFQSVLQSTPTGSGVQLLPTVIFTVPFAIVAGAWTTATGKYKPPLILGFAFMTLGIGLFTTLDASSSMGAWVGYQVIAAIGTGLVITPSLPAAQAALPESDVAASTATCLLGSIGDDATRERLLGGAAYEEASRSFIDSFPEAVRSDIISTYAGAMKMVWQVAIAFTALGFIVSWLVKEIELRKTLDTEYGLKDSKSKEKQQPENGKVAQNNEQDV
ncbi:hypothetical protein G7Y89_g8972 [Cudoniella acicularis]|uniref:Major facilitator superfamily (MFS) profile domain-containing protein n=1 Tax=Cudoniella acicularis TaxID=354080 RepID=A0A8H4W2C9_9HELO|nr:hypothetical protein G7Y89_g8972 [Cudoniella acicularis]